MVLCVGLCCVAGAWQLWYVFVCFLVLLIVWVLGVVAGQHVSLQAHLEQQS